MMRSNVKDVTEDEGYPLVIEPSSVTTEECDFDGDIVRELLTKMNYPALRAAATQVDQAADLPAELPSTLDDGLLRRLHHVLLQVHVVEGALRCPKTGRRFKINNGIPNMLLHEDEL
eukprot:CAMPEP_0197415012 /NCGR_PEP_ID=MMETSP1170-20131217/1617_1 /TAXON_ID=54406 /ORGANISM="Sarcinochrysis sp, Strain CCMP770" /LENGTH=116 /DNA_ID=CAMNT_0042941773 /DNA_START=83 /DNA_END=433 /DNA_ORIENTATION=+